MFNKKNKLFIKINGNYKKTTDSFKILLNFVHFYDLNCMKDNRHDLGLFSLLRSYTILHKLVGNKTFCAS